MNHKIKITAAGWETFSGDFCAQQFENGVSVEALPRLTIDRLAALVACQLVDDEDNEVGQAGAAARLVKLTDVSIPVTGAMRTMTDAEYEAERQQAILANLQAPGTIIYTEVQLGEIASKEGINGLREVAAKWHVNGRAINKIIFEILRAQSEYSKRKSEYEIEQIAARKKASVDAQAAADAREKAISDTARNLTTEAVLAAKKALDEKIARDKVEEEEKAKILAAAEQAAKDAEAARIKAEGIPNAIGPDGESIYVAPVGEKTFEETEVETKDAE